MNKQNIENIIAEAPKGANIVCKWERPLKLYAKHIKNGYTATKEVVAVGRVGIDFSKLKENADRDKEEIKLQDWQEWVTFPFLLQHKTTKQQYLRLYRGTSNTTKPKTIWRLNGEEVTKEEIMPYLTATEKKPSTGLCFQCKIENLIKIHHEEVVADIPQATEATEERVAEEAF